MYEDDLKLCTWLRKAVISLVFLAWQEGGRGDRGMIDAIYNPAMHQSWSRLARQVISDSGTLWLILLEPGELKDHRLATNKNSPNSIQYFP